MPDPNPDSSPRRTRGSARPGSETVRKRLQRRILSEWRGVHVPPDLSGYEKRIGDLVGKILKRAGLEDRLTNEQLAADWKDMVGEFLHRHSRPVSLSRGVLVVAVVQAAVRYDLERVHKPAILGRLQARYGPQKIRNIRFQNG